MFLTAVAVCVNSHVLEKQETELLYGKMTITWVLDQLSQW